MGMTLTPKETSADQVRVLIERKDAIEAEIKDRFEILKANNCTMQTPLVDSEGFPRADIDVWEVRHARVRIIELRNDLTTIMDLIMNGLQGVFDPSLATSSTSEEEEPVVPNPLGLHPFAKVDGVAPGSPAATAVSSLLRMKGLADLTVFLQGLKREDMILSFGSLTQSSFSNNTLTSLANLVAANENVILLLRRLILA